MLTDTGGLVQTVQGPARPETLSATLMHEHVLLSMESHWSEPSEPADRACCRERLSLENLWRIRANPMGFWDDCVYQDPDVAVREVERFKEAGGGAIVDLTTVGLGRNPRALAEISRRTGVPIVCGAGFYQAATIPSETAARTVEDLTEEMVRDIFEGIDDTGVRAGLIGEIGVTEPMAPVEADVLRAAVRAQAATGALLVVHPGPGPGSIVAVADFLEAEGAPPARVVLSHAEERLREDHGTRLALLRRGYTLGFDTFGRDIYMPWRGRQHPSDAQRIEWLVPLVEEGFAGQLVLAQDISYKHELTSYGGYGFGHLLRNILPRMRARGIAEEHLQMMLVENPRRLLPLQPRAGGAVPGGGVAAGRVAAG